jgi:hypothetical protein
MGRPREAHYAAVTAEVEEIAPGTFDISSGFGAPMPELVIGGIVDLVVYSNTVPAMVDPVVDLAEERGRAVFLLIGLDDPEDPQAEGVWGVRRAIALDGDTPRFAGECGEMVDATLVATAERLGRPADTALLLDYQAEVLERYDTNEPPGPIEQAAYEAELAIATD